VSELDERRRVVGGEAQLAAELLGGGPRIVGCKVEAERVMDVRLRRVPRDHLLQGEAAHRGASRSRHVVAAAPGELDQIALVVGNLVWHLGHPEEGEAESHDHVGAVVPLRREDAQGVERRVGVPRRFSSSAVS
jgi:hypothetical protein